VSSLVTSCLLLDQGYRVTIVSKEWASWGKKERLCSQIAGALWEFPSAGCGPQSDAINSLENLRRWALESYEIYCAIAAEPKLATQFGLKLRPLISFFPFAIEGNDIEHERMLEAKKNGMRGFRHSSSLIQERGVNGDTGVVDAFEHLSPMLDSDQSMRFLMDLVQSKGAKIVTKIIQGDLWENEDELLTTFQADVILNAAGLGSRELASDDTLYPARGGVLRVINDGTDFERITHAMVVATDIPDNYNVVFIVPRNDETLILGTITELDKWTTDLTVDTPIIQKMRKQCEAFYPPLKNARLDAEYPLAQGLRPLRKGDVRVEREMRKKGSAPSRIVHSYGHGVAGWTLAFGCASECVYLIEQALKDQPALSMSSSDANGHS
jgi:D-amino-acid oxidase